MSGAERGRRGGGGGGGGGAPSAHGTAAIGVGVINANRSCSSMTMTGEPRDAKQIHGSTLPSLPFS